MMTYEERERIRARLSGRMARWLGITSASDTRRLLDEIDEMEQAESLYQLLTDDEICMQWEDQEALRHNLTRAQQIIALLRADLHHVKTQLFKRDLPPPTYVWRQQAHQPHPGDGK